MMKHEVASCQPICLLNMCACRTTICGYDLGSRRQSGLLRVKLERFVDQEQVRQQRAQME